MNHESRLQVRPLALGLAAIVLVAAGAAGAYFFVRPPATTPMPAPQAGAPDRPTTAAPAGEVVVTLSREAIERAGIETTRVTASTESTQLRVPAVVQPNAYKSVKVTPIVAGRITRVPAELGQSVRRGQTLAEIYAPELAEAQTRYVASKAALDAHEQELRRTEKLVEIGSASRQELEKIHAEHTAATSEVQSHRSRLILLGMSEAQVTRLSAGSSIGATISVGAPLDGVVTERQANAGVNVDPATPLFTVVDLSTVWVVGDLYERDLARVRIGSPVTVTTAAFPDLMFEGKVSYIDPQIKPDTRTAQVRAEIPNPGHRLRLDMYADMNLGETARGEQLAVPRLAIQTVGDRSVVYLADPQQQGRFIEREVQLGPSRGESVEVLSGLKPGDAVVTKGSFSLRAERDRVGLGRTSTGGGSPAAPNLQTARVTVSEKGFDPARLTLRAGVPARITFVRTSDTTCATEIALPSLNIKRPLPLNQAVDVEFTPQKAGEIAFACGMGMFSGTIVVQ